VFITTEIEIRRSAMNSSLTANQLSGRAIGSIFFSGFGALWLFLALYIRQILTPASVSAVALGLALLLLAAFNLLRQAKRWPRTEENAAEKQAFNRINIIQYVAIGIVAFSFNRLHIDSYVLSAITAITGLHLFPLARLFRYPLHYATGGLLTAWAVASVLFAPTEQLQGITAIGTGTILWLSATTTLFLASRTARQSTDALTC
jgi:hypothetical protein